MGFIEVGWGDADSSRALTLCGQDDRVLTGERPGSAIFHHAIDFEIVRHVYKRQDVVAMNVLLSFGSFHSCQCTRDGLKLLDASYSLYCKK